MRHDHDQRCHVIDLHRGSDYYHRCGLHRPRPRSRTTAPTPSTSAVTPDLPTRSLPSATTPSRYGSPTNPPSGNRVSEQWLSCPTGSTGCSSCFPSREHPTSSCQGRRSLSRSGSSTPTGSLIGSHEMTPCPADPCPVYPPPDRWAGRWRHRRASGISRPGDLLSTSASG